jgi:hypothetical protein
MASTGCPGTPCRTVLALLDWGVPAPRPPGGVPLLWLGPLEPLKAAWTIVWRSRGTASKAPITMTRAAVAASTGRIHELGDRSVCIARYRQRWVARGRLEWPWAVALTSLPATRSQVSRRLGR